MRMKLALSFIHQGLIKSITRGKAIKWQNHVRLPAVGFEIPLPQTGGNSRKKGGGGSSHVVPPILLVCINQNQRGQS